MKTEILVRPFKSGGFPPGNHKRIFNPVSTNIPGYLCSLFRKEQHAERPYGEGLYAFPCVSGATD